MNWYKTAQQLQNLYHATYGPLISDIQQNGLKPPVYLAQDRYQAESFAEVPVGTDGLDKDVPEEWLDQIVILSIDVTQLDQNLLKQDPNVRTYDVNAMTFVYNGQIPASAIQTI